MFCEKCGNILKDEDVFCPACGNKVSAPKAENVAAEPVAEPVAAEPVAEPAAVEPVAAEPVAPAATEPAPAAEAVAAEIPVQTAAVPKALKAGGSKLPFILGGIGAAVVVAIVVVIACLPSITNFVKKTFAEPEEYYAYVEEDTAKTMANSAASAYEQILANVNTYDRSLSGNVEVEITEAGRNMLGLMGLAGVDLSWLEGGNFNFEGGVKNNVWNANAGFGLNGKDILSGLFVFDLEKQEMFFQIPELNKDYIGLAEDELDYYFDMDDDDMEEMVESSQRMEAIVKALPNSSKVEKLVEKYMNIAFENLTDVKMGTKTLRAEGITQDCTQLKVTIDEEAAEDCLKAIIKEMEKDKDIQAIIEDVAKACEEDPDDAYEYFLDSLDAALDEISEYGVDFQEGIMTVWVDGSGNVVGRSWETEDYWGDITELKWIMPKQGSKFGYKLSYTEYGEEFSVVGQGKESGSKLTGDFSVNYNGTAIVDVAVKNFNTEKAKEGFINGEFTVSVAPGISSMMDYYSYAAGMLMDAQIVIDAETAKDKANVEVTLIYQEEKAAVITADAKLAKGTSVSAPKEKNVIYVEDYNDFEDWLDGVDYGKFVKNLDKMGLPDFILEAFEEYDSLEELLEDF